jgi:hypothetical protein
VRLVDTAGMRKKARIEQKLEQMSVAATLAALKEAEVVVLVLDAVLGMDEQDLRIARLAEREGRAVVIALQQVGRGRGPRRQPPAAGRRADGEPRPATGRLHRADVGRERPGRREADAHGAAGP